MKNKILLLTTLLILITSLAYAQSAGYMLQQGDIITITVHEQPDLTTRTRVTSDHCITFPLLGKLLIEDLTTQQLELKIKTLLEEDYLVNAQVLIFIEEYHPRQVSVLGEVKNPGKYDMPEEKGLTLLEAIALAGGFDKYADPDKTRIMRTTDGKKETIKVKVTDITKRGKKEKDLLLQPGDLIFIPENFF